MFANKLPIHRLKNMCSRLLYKVKIRLMLESFLYVMSDCAALVLVRFFFLKIFQNQNFKILRRVVITIKLISLQSKSM